MPTAAAVLLATGASKTTAYKAKALIECCLPGLLGQPGRPPAPIVVTPTDTAALTRAVLEYVYAHPGAVSATGTRRRYSDGFRILILDQFAARHDVELEAFAVAVGIPAGTIKDWVSGERPEVEPPASLVSAPGPAPARVEAVLAAWEAWSGNFLRFCKHVWFNLRIPFGRQMLSDILKAHGVRLPHRRGRPVDASARKNGFESFFPGAQWVGDGAELVVEVHGQRIKVNLLLLVDPDSGAFTGASIRPTEDAAAVVEAFQDGVATTGQAPEALLLDNKPSNHSEEVVSALGDTLLLRARPFTPTDKPHVEGAFGLFSQEAPPIVLTATTGMDLALQLAALVVNTWARAANHRPRVDRNNKSRVQLYRDAAPTAEDIASAREALLERQRKQNKARETSARRQDPVVRKTLDEAFERLELDDPDGHLRTAIASWPLNAILAGIAVFEGKWKAGTLPDGVDARYLRAIVQNIAQEDEGWHIAEALLRARLLARDQMLDHLGLQRTRIEEGVVDTESLVKEFVSKAMASPRGIDRTFWLLATADAISPEPDPRALLRLAARRISATSAVPHRERLLATRFLFAKVVSIA